MTEQLTTQPSSLPLVPPMQERSMVERVEHTPGRTELERTLALIVEAKVTVDVFESKTAHTSTLMSLAITTTIS